MFPALDLFTIQILHDPLTAAGEGPDDLDHDLSDLLIYLMGPRGKTNRLRIVV